MLAQIKLLRDLPQAFDTLLGYEHPWNSIITGCIKNGKQERALALYHQMQKEEVLSLSCHAFVALLQACGALKDVDSALELHAQIIEHGFLDRNVFISSTLVAMYFKCDLFAKAQHVFNNLPMRDVVAWTVLISGYVEHGQGKMALECFEEMRREGCLPNEVTFVSLLKACDNIEAMAHIHAEVERRGLLETSLFLGSTLVDMYAKFKHLSRAQHMFDRLQNRNQVLWNALISGYAEHGHAKKALECFDQMQLEGYCPNSVTFVCTLKACGSIPNIDKGMELHAMIGRQGLLESDHIVGSALVDMYAKCGVLTKAQQVLDKLLVRNVISWTALMSGYAEHGQGAEVLNCLEQMQSEGVSPNAVTFMCSLKACTSTGSIDKGKELHLEVERQGILLKDHTIGNTLVDMYVRCGLIAAAQQVFSKLPVRTVVSWTTLIAGYAEHGHGEEALKCFDQMREEGISPNDVSLVSAMKACGNAKAVEKAEELHAEVRRHGLETDLIVGNTLVDMYAKCGMLVSAQQVFDKLPSRSIVSWTALVSGYTEHGHGDEALKCFEKMQLDGVSPDAITYIWVLKACSSIGDVDKGEEIHGEIEKQGLLEEDVVIGNTLVDMYSKCGLLGRAQKLLNKMHNRDIVTWSVLLAGYVDHGLDDEAIHCFEKLQSDSLSPNAILYALVLRSCGSIGAKDKVEELHVEVERKGFLERDLVIGNTLVDTYARCGSLVKAQEAFDKLQHRDVVAWTALMVGYTQLGEIESVFPIFERMLNEGIKPDPAMFVVILNACSRMGSFSKSQMYVEAMKRQHGLAPSIKHETCVIDLLGRAGDLGKAMGMVEKLLSFNMVAWRSVLGACRNSGSLVVGKRAFEHTMSSKYDYLHVSNSCTHLGC